MLIHEAFFYSSDEEFAARLAPFLDDAVSAGQGAIVVTSEQRRALLRKRLRARGDAVRFFDASRWYSRPGAALVAWRDAMDQQLHEGVDFVRAIGEIPLDGDEIRIRHWTRYESHINRAFAGRAAWIVCSYNTRAVPENVLAEVRRTHPIVSSVSGRGPSPPHFSPHEREAILAPAEDRPGAQELSRVELSHPDNMEELRRAVRWQAQSAGLSVDVVEDLLLAMSELVRTSLADGGSVMVRTARQGGEWFCETRFVVRTAGQLPLGDHQLGLVIGSVIADRVEVVDGEHDSVVRFVFGLPRAGPRERILAVASDLFRTSGVRSTGINAVISNARVAKATFYSHYPSKRDLIREWLRSPSVRWFDQVRAEVDARTESPAHRLTTFFDVLGDWLTADGYRGCPFLNTAAEFRDSDHVSRRELADLTIQIQEYFRTGAAEAGLTDVDQLSEQLFLLVPGAITAAVARSSAEPARVARDAAANLIDASARPR